MEKNGTANRPGHSHRGKFTEGLLDNDLILAVLDIRVGQTVLDAGCGNGYMAKLFATQVGSSGYVYAVDPDPHFIGLLRKETRGTRIEVIQGDITKPTPLDSSSVDLLYLSTVIHVFSPEQMQGFVKETKRLLKPDAVLAIVEIEKNETPFGPPVERRYAPEDLQAVIPLRPLRTLPVSDHFYMQFFQNQNTGGKH
jgi:ubiquinone/menaquinone biosynthesis C-methylase UbiE